MVHRIPLLSPCCLLEAGGGLGGCRGKPSSLAHWAAVCRWLPGHGGAARERGACRSGSCAGQQEVKLLWINCLFSWPGGYWCGLCGRCLWAEFTRPPPAAAAQQELPEGAWEGKGQHISNPLPHAFGDAGASAVYEPFGARVAGAVQEAASGRERSDAAAEAEACRGQAGAPSAGTARRPGGAPSFVPLAAATAPPFTLRFIPMEAQTLPFPRRCETGGGEGRGCEEGEGSAVCLARARAPSCARQAGSARLPSAAGTAGGRPACLAAWRLRRPRAKGAPVPLGN